MRPWIASVRVTPTSIVWRLMPMLRLHKVAFPAIIVLGVLQSFSEGIGIGLIIPLLHGLVGGDKTSSRGVWLVDRMESLFPPAAPDQRLLVIAACLFVALLTAEVLGYIHGALFTSIDGRIGHHLRRGIFERLLSVGFGTIERDRSGRLLNVLGSDTWNTSEALKILVHMITMISTVAVYVVLLLLMSWRLTLLVAAGMLLVSGVIRLVTRGVRGLGRHATHSNADLGHRMAEGIDGMQVIRAYGREHYEQDRFDQASIRVRFAMTRLGFLEGAVHPLHEVLVAALLLVTLVATTRRAADMSVLIVFMFVLYRLHPRVKDLEGSRVRLNALAPSVEEVLSVLETVDSKQVESGGVVCSGLSQDIVFDRVSFRYESADEPALTAASFTIAAGQTTALVGPSGGGKSTIIKLILRFYDPTAGIVRADGFPLHELDLDSWRSRIALVDQQGYLFNATVRENISYGKLDASLDEIVEAARKADAHDFIQRLPAGYDTPLGHHGMRLSGGQRQRISVARAIIRDPRILILDEATNALDSISEQWIHETLTILKEDRTVIMIAHRFATIEQADQIVVLEGGIVRERGTLHELLMADDLFARLYRLQNRSATTR